MTIGGALALGLGVTALGALLLAAGYVIARVAMMRIR